MSEDYRFKHVKQSFKLEIASSDVQQKKRNEFNKPSSEQMEIIIELKLKVS